MATPIWQEKEKRWKLYVQDEKQRKAFYSYRQGRAGLIDVKRQASDWLENKAEAIRLEQALTKYLADVEVRSGTENYIQRKNYCDHYMSKLNYMLVSEITDQDWQDIINLASKKGYKGKPLSAKSLSNLKATIIDFTHWAKRSRLIRYMPDLSMPRKVTPKKPKAILQPDDLKKLFQPSDEWYINAWRLMVITGMRPGECYGLTVDDVSGDAIRVNRSINRLGEITPGKTKNATRMIPISSIARTVIESQLAMGRKGVWLFAERDGSPARPNIVYKNWRRYTASRGLTASLYSLRHTFVSIMKSKLPDALLKNIVGHSRSMDTVGVYGHEVSGEFEAAGQIINETLDTLLDTLKH